MSCLAFCWHYLKQAKAQKQYLLGLFLMTIDGISTAISPVAVGLGLVRLHDPATMPSDMWPYAFAILASFPIRLFSVRRGWTWGANAGAAASEILRNNIIDHMQRLPLSAIQRWSPAKVASLITEDCRWVTELMTFTSSRVAGALVTSFVFVVIIAWLSPAVALALLFVLLASTLVGKLTMKMLRRLVEERNHCIQQASLQIGEYIDGLAVFRSFGRTGSALKQLRKAITEFHDLMMTWLGKFAALEVITTASLGFASPISILLCATLAVFSDQFENHLELIPALFLVIATKQTILVGIVKQLIPLRFGLQGHKNIASFLSEKPLGGQQNNFRQPLDISFEKVAFSYLANGPKALKGVSFTAKSGQITAIVGPSGAGKSTIASLLLRFYENQKGLITLGGQDIAKADPEQLSGLVSYVGQDVHLFKASLKANILLGDPDASDETLARVIKTTQLDEVVAALPNGLDTVLGGAGRTLSGGERQRVAIARAMLKNAPVLIFDEATSAMDALTELSVQTAIMELWKNRTVIAITHRLRTIAHVDQILVVEHGQITEHGKHEELLAKNGAYARLWSKQLDATDWRLA